MYKKVVFDHGRACRTVKSVQQLRTEIFFVPRRSVDDIVDRLVKVELRYVQVPNNLALIRRKTFAVVFDREVDRARRIAHRHVVSRDRTVQFLEQRVFGFGRLHDTVIVLGFYTKRKKHSNKTNTQTTQYGELRFQSVSKIHKDYLTENFFKKRRRMILSPTFAP